MGMFTLTLNEVLEITDDVGLGDYPIFDAAHRDVLNTKILNRYDAREIGFETIEMFTFAMSRRMHEIMPYYNQLFSSTQLNIDALNTIKMHSEDASSTTSTENSSGTSETDSSSTSAGKNVNYELPQVALSGNEDYASAAADSEQSGSATGTATTAGESAGSSTTTNTSDVEGFQGSQADLLLRYRETFLNIDVQIIENLSDLFMSVWNTNNAYYEDSTPYGKV